MNSHPLYPLLLRSLDAPLSSEEQQRLDQALAEDAELAKLRTQLLEMREWVSEPGFQFAPFFAAKVLHKLSPEAIQESGWWQDLVYAFQRVSVPAMALMLILFAMLAFAEQSLSLDAITGLSDLSMDDFWTESYYNELGS
ncbi:MAG: hypothetical protein AAF399_12375 [Bacteroidota bacterium]